MTGTELEATWFPGGVGATEEGLPSNKESPRVSKTHKLAAAAFAVAALGTTAAPAVAARPPG